MKIYQFLFTVIYLMVIFVSEITGRTSELLRVTLPNESKLIGKYLTSINGFGFRGFIGIPYAEPPIGELRFRNPVPAAPWTHERKVMDDVNVCIQWNPFARRTDIYGSEDCLYLNVYTPLNNTKPMPVMVYYHGGGFIAGTGNKIFYGPDYLLDNNEVIYISANYRLGPFGFLSTGTEDCPGNFGLKDQVLILKWIQENIRVFGGDPNQVTIFGDSAGGASVTYLMMSPLSKGLFHKGISQSGTYLDSWAEPINRNLAQQRAIKAGKLLDCSLSDNKNWNSFVNCLRTKTAFDVINIFKHFYDWDVDPMVAFPPVVEAPGPNAFISEHPRDVTEVHGDSIPYIIGINLDEGALKTAHIMEIPELYNDVKNNWSKILPIILYYNNYPTHIKDQITDNINRFYFGENKQYTKELNQNFTNIISDGWFVVGMDKYLRKRLEKSKQIEGQTYIYLFAHQGEYSFTEAYKGDPEKFYGVCHMDELLYLFPMVPTLFPASVPSSNDINMRKIMVELWINFVQTGNPTPTYSDLPKWKPTIEYPLEYYRIGNAMDENKSLIEMEKGLLEERVNFWRELYKNLPIKNINEEL